MKSAIIPKRWLAISIWSPFFFWILRFDHQRVTHKSGRIKRISIPNRLIGYQNKRELYVFWIAAPREDISLEIFCITGWLSNWFWSFWRSDWSSPREPLKYVIWLFAFSEEVGVSDSSLPCFAIFSRSIVSYWEEILFCSVWMPRIFSSVFRISFIKEVSTWFSSVFIRSFFRAIHPGAFP